MIIHAKKAKDPFARILNAVLCDKRLSYRARGILAYLLSKPGDWKVMSDDVVNNGTEGRDSIRTCFKELKKFGYAKLVTNPAGGSMWIICEEVGTERLKNGISREPEKPDLLKNGTLTKTEKNVQTTDLDWIFSKQADRVAAIFKRRKNTPWSPKEISSWRKLTKKGKRPLDDDELTMIERYYLEARRKSDNYCRRDLLTLLNNYAGEVDRARSWCEKHPLKGSRKVTAPKVVDLGPEPPTPDMNDPETLDFVRNFEQHKGRLPAGWSRESPSGKLVFIGSNGSK